MFKKMATDYISWMFLIGAALFVIEILFFDGGVIFSLILAIGCLYVGRKLSPRTVGKVLFLLGIVSTIMILINTILFKFFIVALLIYLLQSFYQSKKNPTRIKPVLHEPLAGKVQERESLIKKEHIFSNQFFGRLQTPDYVYEWNNINIQHGIGDITIDLSNTILPKGEAIISIRSFVGNLQVLVPYDVEVRIHHTVLAGRSEIFHNQESRIYNQILLFQTEEFEQAEQKIHLITSVLIGDIEVKRV